jgi:hypothetical protein
VEEGDCRRTDVPVSKPYYGAKQNTPGAVPFASQMTSTLELDFLKKQAQALKEQLEQIEGRIHQLETEI